jgi:hypothetical protein
MGSVASHLEPLFIRQIARKAVCLLVPQRDLNARPLASESVGGLRSQKVFSTSHIRSELFIISQTQSRPSGTSERR